MRGPIALRENTAGRLLRRLGELPAGATRGPGAGGDSVVLVRCTDDTPAAGSGIGAECYPGVVVRHAAPLVMASQEDAGAVWLTALYGEGAAAPAAGGLYWCQLAGPVEIDGDTRPRAFGVGPAAPNYVVYNSTGASGNLGDPLTTTGTAGTTPAMATLDPGVWFVLGCFRVIANVSSGGTGGMTALAVSLNTDRVAGPGGNEIASATWDTYAAANREEIDCITLGGIVSLTEPYWIKATASPGNGCTVVGATWSLTPRPLVCYQLSGAGPGGAGGLTGTFGG